MVGERDVSLPYALNGAKDKSNSTGDSGEGMVLTRDEKEFVEHYRKASLVVKAATLAALTAGNSAASSISVTGSGNRVAGHDFNEN